MSFILLFVEGSGLCGDEEFIAAGKFILFMEASSSARKEMPPQTRLQLGYKCSQKVEEGCPLAFPEGSDRCFHSVRRPVDQLV